MAKEDAYAMLDEHRKNREWFSERYAELVEKYDGEFVAIFGRKILDHDRELEALAQRIRGTHPNDDVFVEFVTSEKVRLVL